MAAEGEVEVLDEVQITGSRIVRRDYVSPNPVQTFDAEQLERLGIVNIGDALTSQVPANVSSFQPRNQGGNPFFVGSTLANLRGLNPYFGTRTLTLVDGHRFVPTNQGQSVDLNVVPALLVQRMEVVTGGASAAYGSDAVSGVVNVMLDRRLEGLKLEADYGTTQRGDGDNYHFGLATGTSLFEGRGHLIAGAEYQRMHSIDDCSAARSWCADSEGLLVNGGTGFETVGDPFTPRDPDLPYRYRVSNLRLNQINSSGVIFNRTSGATSAISANAAGTGTMPFAIGTFGTLDPNASALGGDGASIHAVTSLYPDVERVTAYTRLSLDFTDNTRGYLEASHASVNSFVTQSGPGLTITGRCVSSDYAYLTGALGDAVDAAVGNDPRFFGGCAPTQTLVRKDWNEQIDRYVKTDTRTDRVVLGLEGGLGASSWRWDAYYQFGITDRNQLLNDNNTNMRMDMALDAVIDNRSGSPTFGQAVCRVTRDGLPPGPVDPARAALAVGCVPLNLFGTAALTPEQHAYAFGDLFEHNKIKQDVIAANINGELWQGWGAGPLFGAAGVEYREEKLTNDAIDLPFFQRTDFAAQYGDPFAGRTQVKEAYATLEMSLLKDQMLARDLRVNVAGRRTVNKSVDELVAANPDTKVKINTWKLGAVWDPVDWLRFRGSRSRDLRAAGFRELYYSQSIPAGPPGGFGGGVSNPWLPPGPFGPTFDSAVTVLSGNSSLRPEKATTTTFGFVLSPTGWAEGMRFSADWYRIKLVDGISGGLAQKTIDRCYAGDQFYCAQITGTTGGTPNPTTGIPGFGDITELRAPYENGRPYRAEGIDFAWDHNIALSGLFDGAPGNLLLRVSATHAMKTTIETLVFNPLTFNLEYMPRNVVGQVGPAGFLADYAPSPKWAGNFTASYLNGPMTLTLQAQWTGPGKLNNEAPYTGPGQAGYDPTLAGSVDDNTVGHYVNFTLNGSYSLPFEQLDTQLFMTVSNLLDTTPPFSSSGGFQGGIGGVNGMFYDTLGRSFRLGVRMKF